MKQELIEKEVECVGDCLILAHVAFQLNNLSHTKTMLEDAIKSINEIERLGDDGTIVIVGNVLGSRNHHD